MALYISVIFRFLEFSGFLEFLGLFTLFIVISYSVSSAVFINFRRSFLMIFYVLKVSESYASWIFFRSFMVLRLHRVSCLLYLFWDFSGIWSFLHSSEFLQFIWISEAFWILKISLPFEAKKMIEIFVAFMGILTVFRMSPASSNPQFFF